MKTNFFRLVVLLVSALQFICCKDRFPASYVLELPRPPVPWTTLLGEPFWRVEWMNPDGVKQIADLFPFARIEVEIPVTRANPVSAWPYWPNHNMPPGLFKPAGAMFPFDASGNRLRLSWQAGVDAVFYWELMTASIGKDSRAPAAFDWPRFREVLKSETVKEAVRIDPWVVDWRGFAEKTVSSTFYTSRLSPEAVETLEIPVPAGAWYGASPFAKPLVFAEGEKPAFPVRSGVNVWISKEGILRVSGKTWVFKN